MLNAISVGGLLLRLRRLVVGRSGSGSGVQYECRRCGRTLAQRVDRCPDCGAEDVAHHEL